MKSVEEKARKKRQRRNIRNAVMAAIGTAGLIAMSAIAPNMFQILGRTGMLARLKSQTKHVLTRLKLKGEIEFVEKNGGRYVQLTDRGKASLALELHKKALGENKPKKWDRRYRLVMFDIPERRKRVRDLFRLQMREIGFFRIQDSAWVYPYDCEEFITLLKADLHIGKEVLYAVVEDIDTDKHIRMHFNLPLDD